ncbi:LysM peptidoglycan-binding domain-containing protein, partial [Methylobacillus pratensis]
WSEIPSSSFVPGGFGVGSFTLPTSALGVFVNGVGYDIEVDVRNASGGLIRTSTGSLSRDASGNLTVGALTVPPTLTFHQGDASSVKIRYRVAGSEGEYSAPITLNAGSVAGQFNWNPAALVPDWSSTYDYEFDIQAYDAAGSLIRHNLTTVRLGSTIQTLTNQALSVTSLTVTPPQTGVDYVILGYRLKDSSDDYTLVPTKPVTVNGTTHYRADISGLDATKPYEYQYTAYAPDVINPNDPYNPHDPNDPNWQPSVITTPLGTETGTFQPNAPTAGGHLVWTKVEDQQRFEREIERKQSYNAFGEVESETDGRGNVTSFTYNTLGNLVLKRDPQVEATLANGYQQTITPETHYTYDLSGRLIQVLDANGNKNTQAWLAGAPPDADDMISFERHADGGFVTRRYDIFGNKRSETDRINALTDTSGRTTDYEYDAENRLTKIMRPQRVTGSLSYLATRTTDTYTYDAAGQRIIHTNALGEREKTDYDSLGRVIQTTSYMGFTTSYQYDYSHTVLGLGGSTLGGWIRTTTQADDRTLIDELDLFNRTTRHTDLGGNVFTYFYNQAGWLIRQTGSTGQDIVYDHYANGYVQSIHDQALGMYTYYEYDQNGNKTFEGYVSLKNPANILDGNRDYYQYAHISYDSHNRITNILDPKASISYEYDAVGNRRLVKSIYHDGVNGAKREQEYWYAYDAMNRFTITMGQLGTVTNGVFTATGRATSATDTSIVIDKGVTGGSGVAISYNLAGERTQAKNAIDGTIESYSYTADGYLEQIDFNDGRKATRKNDALGRVVEYKEYGTNGTSVTYSKTTAYDADNRILSETTHDGAVSTYEYYNGANTTYSAGGSGALAHVHTDSNGSAAGGTLTDTYYTYEYWDEAKITATTISGYNASLGRNQQQWKSGYADLRYDVNGHLESAYDHGGNRSIQYISDAQGLILVRDEITGIIARPNYKYNQANYNPGSVANKVTRYYYVDGKRVGDVSNDGPSRTDYAQAMANRHAPQGNYANWKPISSADFDQNYEPISPNYPGFAASSYTVRNGDTLQSIARSLWGDAAMWFLIADANGLTDQALTEGQTLTIPNKVTNVHNNSSTFRPYSAGEAIGDTSPTLPTAPVPYVKKKKGKCGGMGGI